jgi:biotin synthesis protein BioG
MRSSWLQKNKSEHLILFFNGWSCDEHPFKVLNDGGCDILMLNDYRNLTLPKDVQEAMENYQKVSVLAWSFGVWVAQVAMYPLRDKLCRTIAINGTTRSVDKDFGIPAPIAMGTLSGLNGKNLEKFQRRMFTDKEAWQQFIDNKPRRDFEEVKNELFLLLQHFKVQKLSDDFYELAIVSADDRIFPTSSQLNFWKEKATIVELQKGHFCFYDFNNWEEIINIASK